MKVLAGIVGGLIIAILGAIVIAIGGASKPASGGVAPIAFFVLWFAGLVAAILSPSTGKAWRRLLITAAILSFLLPLSGVVFTGSHVAGTLANGGEHAGAAAAGAAIGGTLVSGFMGLVGFFLGAVFLVIGLLVGRDKQVVYVQASPSEPRR